MAVKNITVNTYEIPSGINKSDVVTAAVRFNTNSIESYCNKYIGTDKSTRRRLIKKIVSGVEGLTYTILFVFEKAASEDAKISYTFSVDDYTIIESDQSYSSVSEFSADIEYINTSIENLFK